MTEAEWLACDHPRPMLESVEGKVSDRKLRLWVAAMVSVSTADYSKTGCGLFAAEWARGEVVAGDEEVLTNAAGAWCNPSMDRPGDPPMALRAALLRDIVGNPFRPSGFSMPEGVEVRSDMWGYSLGLASHAWDAPGGGNTLDAKTLSVLADCLEDAGCRDAEVLNHLRSDGPHVRGCWAVDLVLGVG